MLNIVRITIRKIELPVWHWLVTTVHNELTAQARMKSSPGPQFPDDGEDGGPVAIALPFIHAHNPTLLLPSDDGVWMTFGIFPSFVCHRFTLVFVSLTSSPERKAEKAMPTH